MRMTMIKSATKDCFKIFFYSLINVFYCSPVLLIFPYFLQYFLVLRHKFILKVHPLLF